MGKDAYFFSHDSNAKDDPKCVMLIEQLGLEGYGIYWVLVETLRDQSNYKYPLALIPAIARRYNTTAEKMKTVVMNYNLFEIDDVNFFSLSLIERMKKLDDKRDKAREAINKRWDKNKKLGENKQKLIETKYESNTNVLETNNESNTNVLETYYDPNTSKVKYSKVNNSIVNNNNNNSVEKVETPESFYNENIGPIKPMVANAIKDWIEDGVEEAFIIRALQDAINYNVPNWNYANKIIKDSFDRNIKTLAQFEASQNQYKRQRESVKNGFNSTNSSNNKKQDIDGWGGARICTAEDDIETDY